MLSNVGGVAYGTITIGAVLAAESAAVRPIRRRWAPRPRCWYWRFAGQRARR